MKSVHRPKLISVRCWSASLLQKLKKSSIKRSSQSCLTRLYRQILAIAGRKTQARLEHNAKSKRSIFLPSLLRQKWQIFPKRKGAKTRKADQSWSVNLEDWDGQLKSLKKAQVSLFFPKRFSQKLSNFGQIIKKCLPKRLARLLGQHFLAPRHSQIKLSLVSALLFTFGIGLGAYLTIAKILIPGIRALTETSFSMPDNLTFIGNGYDDDGGKVNVLSDEIKLGMADDWWNIDFEYKKDLELSNYGEATQSATISIVVDTASLVTAGKLQADCDDLRLVYEDTIGEGSASATVRREIARDIVLAGGATSCADSTGTKLNFQLQESLGAFDLSENERLGGASGSAQINPLSTSEKYEIYYGNSSATAPSYPGEKYLSFDGVDDYVNIPNYSPGTNSFTVSVWLKLNSSRSGTSDPQPILGNNQNNPFLGYQPNSKQINNLRQFETGSENIYWTSPIQLADNQWHHVAMVTDRSSLTATLFLDGVSLGDKTIGPEGYDYGTSGGSIYHVGRDYGSFMLGNIDEFKIYEKTLSASEILDIKNESGVESATSQNSSLQAYYSFNEQTGQVAADGSSNESDAFLGSTVDVASDDPTWASDLNSEYAIDDIEPTLICPFNGSTTCVGGITPTTATGAIRYESGGSSLEFDGKDDYVLTNYNRDFDDQNKLTIEYWSNKRGLSGVYTPIGRWTPSNQFMVYEINQTVRVFFNTAENYGSTDNILTDDWNHVAIVFDGEGSTNADRLKIFVNGTLRPLTFHGSIPSTVMQSNGPYVTGAYGISASSRYRGFIDDIRVSNVVRYVGNFTPPTSLETDDNTLLLYHFDENGTDPRLSELQSELESSLSLTGTGVAFDASGNGNHGLIMGAHYSDNSPVPASTTASHEGVFIEEGTTNLITNPSFEHATFDTNWTKPYFNLNLNTATFTPNMAKRNSAGPFAAGVIFQGKLDGSGTGDSVYVSNSSNVVGLFNKYLDINQGSISFSITPEWNGNDGKAYVIARDENSGGFRISKTADGFLSFTLYGEYKVDISNWVAGNTYHVVFRWDTKNTIDGTNYASISINDVNSYGMTSPPSNFSVGSRIWLGSYYGSAAANAIIEGLTIYRRVLFDGTYGTDLGNGDEIAQIYNSGTGKDPTLVTGSWDVVFALPTNASTGALTTGTGNAWTMPHSSNLLGGTNGANGFMMGASAAADGWTNFSSVNKLSNSTFDSDLSSWSEDVEGGYLLNDEFSDAGPATLVDGAANLSNGGVISPELGEEKYIADNATFTNGTYYWYPYVNNTITNDANSLKITYVDGQNGAYNYFRNDLSSDVTVGSWYQYSFDSKVNAGSTITPTLYQGDSNIYAVSETNTSFTNHVMSFRSVNISQHYISLAGSMGTGEIIWFDNFSLMPLTPSSLFSTTTEATTNKIISADVTLTTGTQAGLVMNLDSAVNPQNFVIAYHDGKTVRLEKNVAGTYSLLIGTVTNYVPGATLKVIKKGNVYKLIYNGVQIGADQTISDAGIVDNTLQGLFSTYASNSFANFKITENLDGTMATDGVNERTVVDTESKMSISNSQLSLNGGKTSSAHGDPGLWYSSLSRVEGKMLLTKINNSTSASSVFGFDTDKVSNINSNGLEIYYGSINQWDGNRIAALGTLSTSTDYIIATVLKSTGAYYFIKGGTFTNWTLLGISSSGSSTTIYPSINNYNLAFTADNIRIPTTTWLPTPLAYDTFSSAGATTTETLGPEEQTTPTLEWTGGTKTGGSMRISPTSLGEEDISNGSMELGDPPNDWNANFGVLDGVADERTGGSGQQSVSVTTTGAPSYGAATQNLNSSDGSWVLATGWAKKGSSSNAAISIYGNNSYGGYASTTSTNWTELTATGLMGYGKQIKFGADNVNGRDNHYDDMSVKPLVLSELFATVLSDETDVIMDTDIYSSTNVQAGLVFNLDSATEPTAGLVAYLETKYSSRYLKLDKFTNTNTWTNLIESTITYVPGATLRVITDSSSGSLKVRVYYNNALVGSEQTISDASIINNTRHGLFSTYSGNTFDNFTLWPRTGFTDAPFEEITVTRDTDTKYAGAAGLKLVAGGVDSTYLQTANVGNTSEYTLSAYAYTDNSEVDEDDLELYYDGAALTTAYADMGSGWWRLTGTITGVNADKTYGVQVKAGKTVYVDEITLMALAGSGAPSVLSSAEPSERIFAGGYGVTSEQWGGMYQDITVTAGQDLVIRGLAHSDGTSQAQLILYDQTNGAEIGSLYGTTTSTVSDPDILLFTGEAPANCTTIRVKLVNASATESKVYWHQVEVYNNMVDNPSMERGEPADPWVPDGHIDSNLNEGDTYKETSVVHSGGSSFGINIANNGRSEYTGTISVVSGKFYSYGVFAKNENTGALSLGPTSGSVNQSNNQ